MKLKTPLMGSATRALGSLLPPVYKTPPTILQLISGLTLPPEHAPQIIGWGWGSCGGSDPAAAA